MKEIIYQLTSVLVRLKRWEKTALLMTADYFLLVFSFYISLSLRINDFYIPQSNDSLLVIFLMPIIATPIFYFCGLYQSFTRFTGTHSLKIIIVGVSIYTFLWFLIVLIPSLIIKPYDFLFINWLLSTFLIGGIRLLARPIFFFNENNEQARRVLIFGAGSSGRRLASALENDASMNLQGFIDDDPQKHGLNTVGRKIYPREQIEELINKKNISEILIAMPSIKKTDLGIILDKLKDLPVTLRKIPDFVDIAMGNIEVSDLRRIRIEDLLHREVRKPNNELLEKNIFDKNILITGAGGSIGSELCREISKLSPRRIILFEINEFALYEIERELLKESKINNILAILGDINQKDQLTSVMKSYDVETVFHAAAYKHVPLVEKNSISAIRTNIFGTINAIQSAISSGVKDFVFISTDKAVRPSNIMGATKRVAELTIQATINEERKKDEGSQIRASIVRFGNVLGSSGSVVPLFEKQIEDGGPITVTDPNIIRYFMTIKEAAQLVIQSGAMGKDGEIFLLDMGEPIKIIDLARDMIRLSGISIRNDKNPNGDIEILYTGLRPGEKLYEELLVDHKSLKTKHEKIMLAMDKTIEWNEIKVCIGRLENAIKLEDYISINKVFSEIVEDFGSKKKTN